jgi:hypothetical protein
MQDIHIFYLLSFFWGGDFAVREGSHWYQRFRLYASMACLKCCQVNTIADVMVRDVEHGFCQGSFFLSLLMSWASLCTCHCNYMQVFNHSTALIEVTFTKLTNPQLHCALISRAQFRPYRPIDVECAAGNSLLPLRKERLSLCWLSRNI